MALIPAVAPPTLLWDRLNPKRVSRLQLVDPMGSLFVLQLGEVTILLRVVMVILVLTISSAGAPVSLAALLFTLLAVPLLAWSFSPLLELRVQLPTVGLPVPLLFTPVADDVLVGVGHSLA